MKYIWKIKLNGIVNTYWEYQVGNINSAGTKRMYFIYIKIFT